MIFKGMFINEQLYKYNPKNAHLAQDFQDFDFNSEAEFDEYLLAHHIAHELKKGIELTEAEQKTLPYFIKKYPELFAV